MESPGADQFLEDLGLLGVGPPSGHHCFPEDFLRQRTEVLHGNHVQEADLVGLEQAIGVKVGEWRLSPKEMAQKFGVRPYTLPRDGLGK